MSSKLKLYYPILCISPNLGFIEKLKNNNNNNKKKQEKLCKFNRETSIQVK